MRWLERVSAERVSAERMSAEKRAEKVSEGESEDDKGGICEHEWGEEAKKEDKDKRESEDKR